MPYKARKKELEIIVYNIFIFYFIFFTLDGMCRPDTGLGRWNRVISWAVGAPWKKYYLSGKGFHFGGNNLLAVFFLHRSAPDDVRPLTSANICLSYSISTWEKGPSRKFNDLHLWVGPWRPRGACPSSAQLEVRRYLASFKPICNPWRNYRHTSKLPHDLLFL